LSSGGGEVPGTPDGMFEHEEGSLFCVQFVSPNASTPWSTPHRRPTTHPGLSLLTEDFLLFTLRIYAMMPKRCFAVGVVMLSPAAHAETIPSMVCGRPSIRKALQIDTGEESTSSSDLELPLDIAAYHDKKAELLTSGTVKQDAQKGGRSCEQATA